jgi:site-specific DNA-methyltransferase (adenine-specific)
MACPPPAGPWTFAGGARPTSTPPEVAAVLAGAAQWAVATADALEFADALPDECLDAAIMDPPYCSGAYTEAAKRQARGQGRRSGTLREVGWFINDAMGTAGLTWLLRCVAVQLHRALKDGGCLCVFTDFRMISALQPAIESAGFRFSGKPVWDKDLPGLGNGFRAQHEEILHFTNGAGRYYRSDVGTVLRYPRVHQTEKPIGLLADLVTLCAPKGGVVADLFLGSGTTGEACISNGRRVVGCEIMPENAEAARARLAAAERATTAAADAAGQLTIYDRRLMPAEEPPTEGAEA